MKAVKHLSLSEWCKNFEVVFQGEEGKLFWKHQESVELNPALPKI